MTKDRLIKFFDGELPLLTQEQIDKESASISLGAIVDVETTGLDPETCKVTELGFLVFQYDNVTGSAIGVVGVYNYLQDPGEPLTEEIKKLTGITDEELKGKSIPIKGVNALFNTVDLIIAHNAKFDRAFLHPLLSSTRDKLWACSKADVNWKEQGLRCNQLQHLCNDHDFWYDGHRASVDAAATYKLLTTGDNDPHLKELIITANQDAILYEAKGAPFSVKDDLKALGFNWNPDNKVWSIIIAKDAYADLVAKASEFWHGASSAKVIPVKKTARFL